MPSTASLAKSRSWDFVECLLELDIKGCEVGKVGVQAAEDLMQVLY